MLRWLLGFVFGSTLYSSERALDWLAYLSVPQNQLENVIFNISFILAKCRLELAKTATRIFSIGSKCIKSTTAGLEMSIPKGRRFLTTQAWKRLLNHCGGTKHYLQCGGRTEIIRTCSKKDWPGWQTRIHIIKGEMKGRKGSSLLVRVF